MRGINRDIIKGYIFTEIHVAQVNPGEDCSLIASADIIAFEYVRQHKNQPVISR